MTIDRTHLLTVSSKSISIEELAESSTTTNTWAGRIVYVQGENRREISPQGANQVIVPITLPTPRPAVHVSLQKRGDCRAASAITAFALFYLSGIVFFLAGVSIDQGSRLATPFALVGSLIICSPCITFATIASFTTRNDSSNLGRIRVP